MVEDRTSLVAGRLSRESDLEGLPAVLADLASRHGVPGAQLTVYRRGESTVAVAGEEEYGGGQAVTPESKFPIGSVTKAFTATLAVALVSEGDLEYDVPLGEYLPELNRVAPEFATKGTLRQLLTHTGGVIANAPVGATSPTARQLSMSCCAMGTLFEPGTAFSYSNIGYVLVGHLIETTTGMSWWEALQAIVLCPLGIEPSFVIAPPTVAGGRYVSGHSAQPARNRVIPVEQGISYAEGPTGALALSACDLAALGRLHLADEKPDIAPVGARHTAEMRRAASAAEPFGAADGWGLGLALFRTEEAQWWGHDGTADGTFCHLRFDPDGGDVVVLTTNASTGLALWEDLLDDLAQRGLRVGNYSGLPQEEPVAAPPDCLGRYANGQTEYTFVFDEDGTAYLANNQEPFARLTFYPGLVFTMADLRADKLMFTGRFLRAAESGEIDRIVVGGRLAQRQGEGS